MGAWRPFALTVKYFHLQAKFWSNWNQEEFATDFNEIRTWPYNSVLAATCALYIVWGFLDNSLICGTVHSYS